MDQDAFSRALLMAGLGMMNQPNVWAGLSRGGMFGVQGYDQAIEQKRRAQDDALSQQIRAMQLQQATQSWGDQQAERALGQRSFAAGKTTAPDPYEFDQMGAGTPQPQAYTSPGGGGMAEYVKGLYSINPKDALALQQSLAKESPYNKLDPKDYTPESLLAFTASGGHDYTVLRPRTKVEMNNGVAYDPYATKPGTVMDSPFADVVKDANGKWVFNPAKINPLEKQRVGLDFAKFNRGELHEFPTAGGGTSLGFVTPDGVTAVPGSGEKMPEQPAAIRTAVASSDVLIDKIDRATQAVQSYPQAFGAKNYLGDAVRQRTNPEGVDARALVADIGSQVLHDRSGASVTISEAPRLQPFVPAATDNDQTILKKLKLMRIETAKMRDELAGGRSIRQVAAPSDVTAGGQTPSIAEIQAEMLRRGKRGT